MLAVVTIASALALALLHGDPTPQLAVAYVIYLIPGRFPRREALALLGGTLAALAAAAAALPGRDALTALAENGVLVAGAWLIGYAVTQQRAYAKAVRSQQERDDRIRIARELHDVVAHGLSLIAVQAGVARLGRRVAARRGRPGARLDRGDQPGRAPRDARPARRAAGGG